MIRIHPIFWLFAGLIGWLSSGTLYGTVLWVGIIFVSVLVHEFGHALTAMLFGQKTSIQLVALGGVTSYDGPKLRLWQQFLIVLNGPLFGFGLFLLATWALHYDWSAYPVALGVLRATQIANLFWSVVNLFPVLPLDGGQLLRIVLEGIFGPKGYRVAVLLGALFGFLSALTFFLLQQFLAGALFFLFAFQSFDLWRKSRKIVKQDSDEGLKRLLMEAEVALTEGRPADAETKLVEIRSKTNQGMLYLSATQFLAALLAERGAREEGYQLLASIEADLTAESRCLLHDMAAEHRAWDIVARLAAESYQTAPSQLRALNSARAFAALGQPEAAGGWLQTAWQFGGLDLGAILNEEEFRVVATAPEFREFVSNLS